MTKVEPPGGDPLARMCPCYYEDLSAGQEVVRLDLKDQQDRASLDDSLVRTDLLTASRPAALGGVLGGGFPGYRLYRTREGHVALGVLEPHFWERLLQELEVKGDRQDLERIFGTKTAEQWEEWATERDLPLAAVRHLGHEENREDETMFASERRRASTRGDGRP